MKLEVRDGDMKLATLAFGWTIGFGYFVTWHVIQLTKRPNAFIIMCWLQILVCATLATVCWLYLCGIIEYSFWCYFTIVIAWALQVQFYLQIIVNRMCTLLRTPRQRFWLKFTTAVWIAAINISVCCVWVPAKLQISKQYHDLNLWWDRVEKILYLITDGVLNYVFVRLIKKRLGAAGLTKCDELIRFNEKITAVSIAMDILIITMMSHPNDFVYMQFHPLAYIVKLEIELCTSELMIQMATGNGTTPHRGVRLDSLSWRRNHTHATRSANHYMQSRHTVNIRMAAPSQSIIHADLDSNNVDIRDTDLGCRDHRTHSGVPSIGWEQPSHSEPIEAVVHQLGANTVSKIPPRTGALNPPDLNKHKSSSSVTVGDPDIRDIEKGSSHSGVDAEVMDDITGS